jgi:hypothetical protein
VDADAAKLAPIDRQKDLIAELGIQKAIKDMVLGFCSVDLTQVKNDGWIFSTWNKRALDKAHVSSMANGMLKRRVCDEESGIQIALRRSWFTTEMERSLTGKRQAELPLLKLTDEGRAALERGEFRPFGGNHRRAAVELLTQNTEMKLKSVMNSWEYHTSGKEDGMTVGEEWEYSRRTKDFQQQVALLKGDQTWVHLWHLTVWDLGICF